MGRDESVDFFNLGESETQYSCLISVYAKENPSFLQTCLECVINQTVPPSEIVIVKDGPLTEELESVLALYMDARDGFTIVAYPENKGLWHALNVGVRACKNDLIMRMDVDDWCTSDRAEKQIDILNTHPEIDCVGSNVVEFEGTISNPVSLVALPETHESIIEYGLRRCPYRHPTLMYRKAAVLRAGSYQNMPYFEDYDLYMRMKSAGSLFYNIQENLVYVRASSDFFERRGGVAYTKNMMHFKSTALRRGDYDVPQFLISVIPHAIVCLAPGRVRRFIYKFFLRSQIPKSKSEINNPS